MHRGALVPDTTVLDLVAERVRCLHCAGGFVLDGFPRTVAQAQALEVLLDKEGLGLDAVFDYQLPIDEIVARLGGRRVCPACKEVYHLTGRPPRRKGLCDACGAKLQIRDDDRPEAIQTRMRVYEETIAPLLEFYATRGLLVIVPAQGTPDEVYHRAWTCAGAVRPGLDAGGPCGRGGAGSP
jgi:adenylate kinase